MDMSSVSTEALRQELRFRQARLAAPLERSCGKRPRIPEVQDHSDHDSLFVPERRTNFTYEDSFRSREGSKQHESYPLQSMPERKRRRARSPEVKVSVRFSHRDSRFPATQQQRPDIEPAKEIKFETVASRCQSLTQQEEEDRRFAERLQAEEDLVFAETPLSSLPYANQVLHNDDCQSAIGSKSDPIDLDLTPFSINRSHLAEAEAGKQAYMSALYQREMDDAAMALQLHEEEQQAQEERERQAALQSHDCSVCSEKTLFIDLPSLSSCLHQPEVCSGCYVSWIASQLEANGWQEVRCPGTSCKVNLAYEEIKAFASEDVFERYDTFRARDALVSDPNFRWCRTEGCASGQIHDSDEVGNTFICVECDTHFCTVHDVVHHDGETCEAYEYRTSGQKERDERKKNEEASEEAVGKLTKKCPKETCGCPIQKNGGCNHMTCWKCQHNFCFVCLSSNWGRCGHLHV